jgi:hypothetical protein
MPQLGERRRYDVPGAGRADRGHAAARAHDRRRARQRLGRSEDDRPRFAISFALARHVRGDRAPYLAGRLVRLGILRSGSLVRANLGIGDRFGCLRRVPVRRTLYLQHTLGWSALETALAFLPGGLLRRRSARRGWAP